ncbi:MAG: hypothetical protein J4478_04890 [Candidatus Diapherotrites archaeon]|nr:hypothetical protein [Candidatus Diapherotrites archaeon]HIH32832.1 hypothetical protein [Candidatus Diapherotrites archaeon]
MPALRKKLVVGKKTVPTSPKRVLKPVQGPSFLDALGIRRRDAIGISRLFQPGASRKPRPRGILRKSAPKSRARRPLRKPVPLSPRA